MGNILGFQSDKQCNARIKQEKETCVSLMKDKNDAIAGLKKTCTAKLKANEKEIAKLKKILVYYGANDDVKEIADLRNKLTDDGAYEDEFFDATDSPSGGKSRKHRNYKKRKSRKIR